MNQVRYPPTAKQKLRLRVVGAVLLIFLGLGNALMGHFRSQRATSTLQDEYIQEMHDETITNSPFDKAFNIVEDKSVERRQLHKKRFYDLVGTGGQIIVIIGAVYLLALSGSTKEEQ